VPHETVTYRRTQLYEEVWTEPVEAVAKRYGISGVALGKVCRKLDVPVPGRGYWARKRAGQRLKRLALPAAKKGQQEQLNVSRWIEPERPKPVLSPETQEMIAKEAAPEAAIKVAAVLGDPHKLVALSAKLLQRTKPFNGVVRVRDRRCLDVAVSPGALDRALRVMEALVRAIEERGLELEVTNVHTEDARGGYAEPREGEPPSNVTRVRVAGEWIQFSLAEKIAQKRPPPPPAPAHLRGAHADIWQSLQRPPREYEPTGILTLAMTGRSGWRDGKRRRVEDCLNEFVSSLYVQADAIKTNRIEQERRKKEWEREQERRWKEQRRQEEEARRAKELEGVIGQWRYAHDVRAYVAEARQMVADAELTMNEDSPFNKWLQFASSYAEKIDPLCGLRADIAKVLADKPQAKGRASADADPESSARPASA
jgi:hypothetical protein